MGTTPAIGTCLHGEGFPSQINLQIAAPKTVVVSFVTFEPTVPAATPIAYIGKSSTDLTQATGAAVTHVYVTSPGRSGTNGRAWAGNRTYLMHFVVFAELAPRTRYYYKVCRRTPPPLCPPSTSVTIHATPTPLHSPATLTRTLTPL